MKSEEGPNDISGELWDTEEAIGLRYELKKINS